jgi:hypothetical protein
MMGDDHFPHDRVVHPPQGNRIVEPQSKIALDRIMRAGCSYKDRYSCI